jgi:tripartite-type tricarboxylate transporter receptor subunit TctC
MKRLLAVYFALALAWPAAVVAQSFPNRPLNVIIPFPPGGVADLTMRAFQPSIEKQFKQPLVMVNRPGAAGAIGMGAAANAPADGYTVTCSLVSISVLPEVDALFGRQPVYQRSQFAPIALLSADPPMLVINAELPWKTLKDMLDDARSKPDQYIYSSSGLYGASHVPMEMLLQAAGGLKMKHLPTTGGAPATTAVLGNHAQMWASPPSVASGHLAAGKMRALGVFGDKRLADFPNVPTMKEQGYDVEYALWAGVFAPKATPAAAINIWRQAIKAAANDPETIEAMKKIQTPIAYLDAPEFQKFWDKDAEKLAKVVKQIGKVEEQK